MVECDFALKIDDILSLIQKYNPQIITKKSDYLEVKIVNEFDEELWIEVDDMISIFLNVGILIILLVKKNIVLFLKICSEF